MRIEELCDFDSAQILFYGVYASKYNKETINTLQEEMSFLDFMAHKQFVEMQEDLETESYQQTQSDRK